MAHTPGLGPCLVEAASAHMTLLVMTLSNEAQVAAAARCLTRRLPRHLSSSGLLAPLTVTLRGLNHFRNQVCMSVWT